MRLCILRITIVLPPHIAIGPSAKEERGLRFVEMAHEQYYIANTLETEIVDVQIEVRKT